MSPLRARGTISVGLLVLVVGAAIATTPAEAYVVQRAPVLVLDHVRVIDGTGKPAAPDQRLVISAGKVAYLGPRTPQLGLW